MKSPKTHNKLFVSNYDTSNVPTGYDLYHYEKLSEINDKSLDEIFISDILDYYTDNNIPAVLSSLIAKIKHSGKLHIQSIDLEQFCFYLSNKVISTDKKYLLFNNKNNIQTLASLCNILLQNRYLQIISRKYLNGFEYYIELQINHEK